MVIHIPPLPGAVALPRPTSREPVRFAPGTTSATFTASLGQDRAPGYRLRVLAGQRLWINASGNPTLTVLDPDDNLLTPVGSGPGSWQVAIPRTGDYTLIFQGAGEVTMTLTIPPL